MLALKSGSAENLSSVRNFVSPLSYIEPLVEDRKASQVVGVSALMENDSAECAAERREWSFAGDVNALEISPDATLSWELSWELSMSLRRILT